MINWVVRGVVLLWAALFLLTGFQGLTAAAPYFDLAGPLLDPTGRNTVRADLSSFFLVSAVFAVIGVLRSGWTHALLVPAALFGTALLGRLLGLVAFGDSITAAITQAMIAEAISVALLLGAWWHLSRVGVVLAGNEAASGKNLPD